MTPDDINSELCRANSPSYLQVSHPVLGPCTLSLDRTKTKPGREGSKLKLTILQEPYPWMVIAEFCNADDPYYYSGSEVRWRSIGERLPDDSVNFVLPKPFDVLGRTAEDRLEQFTVTPEAPKEVVVSPGWDDDPLGM